MKTSNLSSRFVVLALALPCSVRANAAQTQSLHPVILVDSEGSLPTPVASEFLTAATRATSDAILKSTAKGSYGIDRNLFPAAHPFRGQVEMLADILGRLDANLQTNNLQLKARAPGQHTVRYQFFWTSSNVGAPPIADNVVDLLIGALTKNTPNRPKNLDNAIAIGEKALKARFSNEDKNLVTSLQKETFDNFGNIISMQDDIPVWPLHIWIEFIFDGEKGTQTNIRFLFGSNSLRQGKKDIGTAILDKFIYSPSKKGRGVFELSLSRSYPLTGTASGEPMALVTFGTLKAGNMRPVSCLADECAKWMDALPTMYMRIDPKENGWFTRTQAWLASFDKFEIMFKSVGINLKDRSIDPANTGMIFYVDAYTGGAKVIDMRDAKPKNWFEAFVQRKGAIEGQILPAFDAAARRSLDDMMKVNLDSLIFSDKKSEQ